MNRSFARWAALACTSAALALFSAGAFAQATITLTDSNCLSFSLGGTPPNQTLTCVQSTTPLCTISGPAAATIGNAITLTANCVPAATSYVWTPAACVGSAKTCSDSGAGYANNSTINYTVTGTNAQGAGPTSAVWPVVWTNTPPQAPGGCSISGAPSGNQPAGTIVNLTLNCTTGGAPSANGYVWTGAGTGGMTGITAGPITVNQSTTFTATASNAGGTSAAASATVSITGGGGINCTGFTNTRVLPITWSSSGVGVPIIVYSKDVGGFGPNDALVVSFTTPSGTANTVGSLETGEYQSGTADIILEVATTACDFAAARNTGQGVSFGFSVGPNSQGALPLNPSTTYYVNMKHDATCTSMCNIIFTLNKPAGL